LTGGYQYLHGPSREPALGNGVVEVPDGKVRIVLGHLVGLVPVEVLDPLVARLSNFYLLPIKLKK
jgi:hypothetical protein